MAATLRKQGANSIDDVRLVLIPTCWQAHWTLYSIRCQPNQPMSFEFWDSLPNAKHMSRFNETFSYVQCLMQEMFKEFSATSLCVADSPIQSNSFDCGVFVCQTMDALINSNAVEYEPTASFIKNSRTELRRLLSSQLPPVEPELVSHGEADAVSAFCSPQVDKQFPVISDPLWGDPRRLEQWIQDVNDHSPTVKDTEMSSDVTDDSEEVSSDYTPEEIADRTADFVIQSLISGYQCLSHNGSTTQVYKTRAAHTSDINNDPESDAIASFETANIEKYCEMSRLPYSALENSQRFMGESDYVACKVSPSALQAALEGTIQGSTTYVDICQNGLKDPSLYSSWDIDSLLAFPPNLSCIQSTLTLDLYPNSSFNIATNLHVRVGNRMLKDIKHLQLGKVDESIYLYALFVDLDKEDKTKGGKTNHMREIDIESVYDCVILPALKEAVPQHYHPHVPLTFRYAKSIALAPREGRSGLTATLGRKQPSRVDIPALFLPSFWHEIQKKTNTPLLAKYRFIPFLNCKDVKTRWRSLQWKSPLLQMLGSLKGKIDWEQISPDEFFIDIAKEVHWEANATGNRQRQLSAQDAHTVLWRSCCLSKIKEAVDNIHRRRKGLELKGDLKPYTWSIYPWFLNRDVASVTIEPKHSDGIAKSGLAYCQFYNTTKKIVVANKTIAFDNENINYLALDPYFVKAREAVEGVHIDPGNIKTAYLFSKKRILEATTAAIKGGQPFSARQEFRVSMSLMRRMLLKLDAMGLSDTGPTPSAHSFLVLPTALACSYISATIDKYCTTFELVRASSRLTITFEATKIMRVLLDMLRCSTTALVPHRESYIWNRKVNSRPEISDGLNISHSLNKYGVAWLPHKFDWHQMRFLPQASARSYYSLHWLKSGHRARWREVSELQTEIELEHKLMSYVSKLCQLDRWHSNQHVKNMILDNLVAIVIRLYRANIIAELQRTFKESELSQGYNKPEFSSEDLAGLTPITWEFLIDRGFNTNLVTMQQQQKGKLSLDWVSRGEFMLGWSDTPNLKNGKPREGWASRPWRVQCKLTYDRLLSIDNKKGADKWYRRCRKAFMASNELFPHPSNDKFWQFTSLGARRWYHPPQFPFPEDKWRYNPAPYASKSTGFCGMAVDKVMDLADARAPRRAGVNI